MVKSDSPGVGGVDPLELFRELARVKSPRLEVELRPLVDLL